MYLEAEAKKEPTRGRLLLDPWGTCGRAGTRSPARARNLRLPDGDDITTAAAPASQQRGSAARIIPSACVEKAIPATTQS